MRKRLCNTLLLWIVALMAQAQIVVPVSFTSALHELEGDKGEMVFEAVIDPGWHVYSTDLGQKGPIEATLNVVKADGVELVGKLQPKGKQTEQYDPMFGTTLRYFEGAATFVQKIRFTKETYTIDCYLEYGACSDKECLPPSQVELKKSGKLTLPKAADKPAEPVAETAPERTEAADTLAPAPIAQEDIFAPITSELKAFSENGSQDSTQVSWWFIFLQGLLGGFLAILTPCVWPIIPMTVSFFLKRNKSRSAAIREAIAYGIAIVVIYMALGLFVTLLFGASALNALSTNALMNIFLALLLVMFAASFLGAFELTLPSSWTNWMDRKSENATGMLSIVLMAFTLALVSFSCTGPIIGLLLVAVSTQGSIIAPTIGMLGFAIALAIPFAFFALFPSLLKSLPKSGGWMNTVKVVLAFIELAFALKFVSVADLAYGWHLLNREVFISLWIVLFALLGCYLLGWLKFKHDDESRHIGVTRFFLALASLSFAVYMVPGLWGAPLKAISAFTPPMNTQDFRLYQQGSVEARFTDYKQALTAARAEGKPVMIDFTGFGCVNCRKMEAAVWTDPRVEDILNNRYVVVSLYVDDKTPLPAPVTAIEADGQQRTLRTVGDKWSYLQRTKVGANTQPCYVLLDPRTGKPLNGLRSYDEDIEGYVEFLQTGLDNYKQ